MLNLYHLLSRDDVHTFKVNLDGKETLYFLDPWRVKQATVFYTKRGNTMFQFLEDAQIVWPSFLSFLRISWRSFFFLEAWWIWDFQYVFVYPNSRKQLAHTLFSSYSALIETALSNQEMFSEQITKLEKKSSISFWNP